MQEDNELRVNLKHLAYYTLLWIVYIDNKCNIYKAPKARNYKYLVRMYWMLSKVKYRNTDYIYGWHLAKRQQMGVIIMELERFFTEKCLNRQEWWNCIASTYL